MLFGDEHVRRYVETDGREGHDWNGASVLILTTTGRQSGQQRNSPLIYGENDGGYLVVASKGGADEPPAWYLNLQANPEVAVQVHGEKFTARARTATAEEKPALWRQMAGIWPQYDDYQRKTDREIPVVILEPQPA
jgi:deazaflavin-dependent oxidoreductase (nitroreductase family)